MSDDPIEKMMDALWEASFAGTSLANAQWKISSDWHIVLLNATRPGLAPFQNDHLLGLPYVTVGSQQEPFILDLTEERRP